MKAVVINEFDGVGVLKVQEAQRPIPADDEILVKIFASGVNPVDSAIRKGGNDLLRPLLKLPLIPGCDAAGTVEEVGSKVSNFKEGDAVFGCPNFPGDGSYAEYVAAKATQFAIKPASLSFTDAAAVPLTSLVAWMGLFELGQLEAGQRVIILGASGGVGSFAVQLAKAKSAHVIAFASEGNIDFLKNLGADEVYDYKKQKLDALPQDIDLLLDASPIRDNDERLKSISVLKSGGTYVSANVDFPFDDNLNETFAKRNITGKMIAGQNHTHLEEIAKLIDDGKVKVFVSKVYSLEEVSQAHEDIESWHVQGKIVLELQKDNQDDKKN